MFTLIVIIGLGLPVGEQVDQVVFHDFKTEAACQAAAAAIIQQTNARLLAEPSVYSSSAAVICVPQKTKG